MPRRSANKNPSASVEKRVTRNQVASAGNSKEAESSTEGLPSKIGSKENKKDYNLDNLSQDEHITRHAKTPEKTSPQKKRGRPASTDQSPQTENFATNNIKSPISRKPRSPRTATSPGSSDPPRRSSRQTNPVVSYTTEHIEVPASSSYGTKRKREPDVQLPTKKSRTVSATVSNNLTDAQMPLVLVKDIVQSTKDAAALTSECKPINGSEPMDTSDTGRLVFSTNPKSDNTISDQQLITELKQSSETDHKTVNTHLKSESASNAACSPVKIVSDKTKSPTNSVTTSSFIDKNVSYSPSPVIESPLCESIDNVKEIDLSNKNDESSLKSSEKLDSLLESNTLPDTTALSKTKMLNEREDIDPYEETCVKKPTNSIENVLTSDKNGLQSSDASSLADLGDDGFVFVDKAEVPPSDSEDVVRCLPPQNTAQSKSPDNQVSQTSFQEDFSVQDSSERTLIKLQIEENVNCKSQTTSPSNSKPVGLEDSPDKTMGCHQDDSALQSPTLPDITTVNSVKSAVEPLDTKTVVESKSHQNNQSSEKFSSNQTTNHSSVQSSPLSNTPDKVFMTNGSAKCVSETQISDPIIESGALSGRQHMYKRKCNFYSVQRDPNYFSVVSYNVLADSRLLNVTCPWQTSEQLSMKSRHPRFCAELEEMHGDVICLQEIDEDYYHEVLAPYMKSQGYDGVYKMRSGEKIKDGGATFYSTSKFSLISSRLLLLRNLLAKDLSVSGVESEVQGSIQRYMNEPDAVLFTQLKLTSTSKVVTIVNIHVAYACYKKPDIQTIQICAAVREAVAMAGGPSNPIIVAGDFNSESNWPGYQVMKEGYLNDDSMAKLQKVNGVELLEDKRESLINLWWKGFQHTCSNFQSSYKFCQDAEPVITAYSVHFNRFYSLDYIWHNAGLENIRVLSTNSSSEIEAAGPMPNSRFPSDHISLKADFILK